MTRIEDLVTMSANISELATKAAERIEELETENSNLKADHEGDVKIIGEQHLEIIKLQRHIEALNQSDKAGWKGRTSLEVEFKELVAQRDLARKQLEDAKSALKFYADGRIDHEPDWPIIEKMGSHARYKISDRYGCVARETLRNLTEEKVENSS